MNWRNGILILLGLSIFLTSYLPAQDEFHLIITLYSIAFGAYALMIKHLLKVDHKVIATIFIITGLTLIFTFPNLSDDIYRFYWDAALVGQGISPYAFLPSELLSNGILQNPDIELYEHLNSKEYHSIYPPFNQLFYYCSGAVSSSVITFSLWLKAFYFIIIIIGWQATLRLSRKEGLDPRMIYVFYMNPLVLVEGMGNLHVELVMLSFLALAFYAYKNSSRATFFASNYAAAIAIKLNPLLISPFFWFHQKRRWRLHTVLITGLLFLLLLTPVIWWSGHAGFMSSVDLYFRKFEFNGGIYYVLRYLGKLYSGYNMIAQIGPLMGLIVLVSIFFKAYKDQNRELNDIMRLSLWSWTLYLLLSTTIHPWYILPLIYFAIFTGRRYPLVWSYLITWTYINYSYNPYYENLWVVTFEYIILLGVILIETGNHITLGGKVAQLFRSDKENI